jgi:hypothetical protein
VLSSGRNLVSFFYLTLFEFLLLSVLGKTPLSKKAHEKSLTSIEQSLMAGPNCQVGQGKDGTVPSKGEQWLL